MVKVTMKIDGMMCGMCEAHINDVIRKNVPGAAKISSFHRKGESSFICEEKPDMSAIKEAITQTGYELSEYTVEPYEKKKWGLF